MTKSFGPYLSFRVTHTIDIYIYFFVLLHSKRLIPRWSTWCEVRRFASQHHHHVLLTTLYQQLSQEHQKLHRRSSVPSQHSKYKTMSFLIKCVTQMYCKHGFMIPRRRPSVTWPVLQHFSIWSFQSWRTQSQKLHKLRQNASQFWRVISDLQLTRVKYLCDCNPIIC